MQIKKLITRYRKDLKFQNKINLYNGAVTSTILMIVQAYGGIRYQSIWFGSFAFYYAILAVVKLYLAKSIEMYGVDGWRVFQLVGFAMTLLNIALVVMISIMIANPEIALHEYSYWITIATGIWTLISAGMTIKSVIEVRRKNNPVALADRLVQLITSAVSVLIFQTSLIASISTSQIELARGYIEQFAPIDQISSLTLIPNEVTDWFTNLFQQLATTNSITGTLVAIFAGSVSVYMIIRGTVERKKIDKAKRSKR